MNQPRTSTHKHPKANGIIRVLICVTCCCIANPTSAFDSIDDARQWAITGLNIIEVATGDVHADRTIIIQHGVIKAVGDDDAVAITPDTIVLDYEDHYVIPGLWDMHVHIRGGPDLINANERWLRQYLGFGITTVRDAGGDLPNSVLHWKAEVAQGHLAGPRIYSALRKIDGVGDRQSGSIGVDSSESIDRAIDNLVFAGVDFIKLYDFSLSKENFALAVSKAESRGLRTSAHVPPKVPMEDLVDAGLDSIEHAFFLVKAANPDDRHLAALIEDDDQVDYVGYFRELAALGDGTDITAARKIFQLMASKGTAVVSTLHYLELPVDSQIDNPRRAETPQLILDTHERSREFDESVGDELWPIMKRLAERSRSLLKVAAGEGVMILAGSDTGANNPYLYPGDSLHAELEAMVEAGIPRLKALQSATSEPARWMGLYPTAGTISQGSVADLVILTSNPLERISNTRSIAAVVQQGVYFDRSELEDLKELSGE